MKSIDFKNFRAYNDISHRTTTTADIRRDFADLIYKNMNGIVAHDLALRIYRSEALVVVNEEEEKIIMQLAEKGLPIFIDSLRDNMSEIEESVTTGE